MRPVNRLVGSVAGIAVALAPALMVPTGTGTATASPDVTTTNPTFTAFKGVLRRCDFSATPTIANGDGTGYALIGTSGGMVTADIHIQNARANTPYIVRLVQLPRTGIRCGPGDPGTAVATMVTNAGRVGDFRIESPLMPGATNAFVQLEGPPGESIPSGDFYSTDFAPAV